MRHHNPKCKNQYFGYTSKYIAPFGRNHSYARPNKNRTYIKVLQYIKDNPGCKRYDVICDLCRYDRNLVKPYDVRGQYSTLFANLLYDNMIDYDKKYRYEITECGENLLMWVEQNEQPN